MTILIGALCDGGDTVLLLSDNMITTSFGLVFEAKTKGLEFTPTALILTALCAITTHAQEAVTVDFPDKNLEVAILTLPSE